jgi:hypothetical protein
VRKQIIKRQENRGKQIEIIVSKAYEATKDIKDVDERILHLRIILLTIAPTVRQWLKHSVYGCFAARVTALKDKSPEILWTEFAYFSDRILAPHRLCFLLEFCNMEKK